MKSEKCCTAVACSLRGIKVTVEADRCVLCGEELQTTEDDLVKRLFGNMFGGASPFGGTP